MYLAACLADLEQQWLLPSHFGPAGWSGPAAGFSRMQLPALTPYFLNLSSGHSMPASFEHLQEASQRKFIAVACFCSAKDKIYCFLEDQ